MEPWPSARPAPTAAAHPTPSASAPIYYVPLARRIVADLRDAPVAIGAFALVARAYRIAGQPVPLSPGDLRAYDPSLSYGAATRALQRLVAAGWLVAARNPGRKTAYTPTWGLVRGAALAWDLAAPTLGRPRHIGALRLDQRLLDVCLGRLDPHPTHPALIDRYLETPLLGLREVGAYALALAGLPVASAELVALGLLAGGRAQPLPDEATILAVASQRGERALTPAGWRRTPFRSADESALAEVAPGQALFFVPPGQIGRMIGEMIAGPITIAAEPESGSSPSEQPKSPPPESSAGSHGVMDSDRENPTTGAAAAWPAGGGDTTPDPTPPPQPPAANETIRMLRSVGVRRAVAHSLADRPQAQVARVIAQARARTDVRDLAGWVVSALRELPDAPAEAPPPAQVSPAPILFHPGLSGYERQIWLSRFRAAEPADRQAILDRFFTEFGHVAPS